MFGSLFLFFDHSIFLILSDRIFRRVNLFRFLFFGFHTRQNLSVTRTVTMRLASLHPAGMTATASIETSSPRGSATFAGAERAGGGSGMCRAYTALSFGKSSTLA